MSSTLSTLAVSLVLKTEYSTKSPDRQFLHMKVDQPQVWLGVVTVAQMDEESLV